MAISLGLKKLCRRKYKTLAATGYIHLHIPDHPNSGRSGWVSEHRFFVSKYIGRPLNKGEEVHHLDLNKQNNDLSNLVLFKNHRLHNSFHRQIYRYVLEKFGLSEIRKYADWFEKEGKVARNGIFMFGFID